jgi:hypothetical protein
MIGSAICFLRYAGWAAAFSGWYGLSDPNLDWHTAQVRATFYFRSFLLLEVLSIAIVSTWIRLRNSDLPVLLKLIARFGISTALALLGSAGLTAIIGYVASQLHFL